jgi:hypothetical protein
MKRGEKVFISRHGPVGDTIAVRRPSETEYLYIDMYDVQKSD